MGQGPQAQNVDKPKEKSNQGERERGGRGKSFSDLNFQKHRVSPQSLIQMRSLPLGAVTGW